MQVARDRFLALVPLTPTRPRLPRGYQAARRWFMRRQELGAARRIKWAAGLCSSDGEHVAFLASIKKRSSMRIGIDYRILLSRHQYPQGDGTIHSAATARGARDKLSERVCALLSTPLGSVIDPTRDPFRLERVGWIHRHIGRSGVRGWRSKSVTNAGGSSPTCAANCALDRVGLTHTPSA